MFTSKIVAGDVVTIIDPADGLARINGVFDLLNVHAGTAAFVGAATSSINRKPAPFPSGSCETVI